MTAKEWKDRFTGIELPAEIRLDAATVIKDPKKCVDSHIAVIGNNQNTAAFGAFDYRLQLIWNHIEQSRN